MSNHSPVHIKGTLYYFIIFITVSLWVPLFRKHIHIRTPTAISHPREYEERGCLVVAAAQRESQLCQPAYNIRENKLSNFSSSYIVAEGQFIFVLPFQFGCLRYIAIAIPFSATRPSPFASVGNPYWMTMSIRLAVRGRLLLWVAAPRRGAELSDNIDTTINILINYHDNVEIHKLVIKDLNSIIKRFNGDDLPLENWVSHYV